MRKQTVIILLPVILIFLLAGVFLLQEKPYYLNRTLRETALRLIQVSVLSRTTGLEYRIEFNERGYSVARTAPESGDWETESAVVFGRGIQCSPAGLRCYFIRGRFAGYEINETKGPRYILLHLKYPHKDMRRSLIFFRKGDWRAIGSPNG
jgi:hypothetical protein